MGGLGLGELTQRRRVKVVRGGDMVITRVEGSNITVLTRDGILARVVEADIRCTNGYIHLIDRVIVKPQPMTLGSALRPSPGSTTVLLLVIIILYFIKTVPFIKLVIF